MISIRPLVPADASRAELRDAEQAGLRLERRELRHDPSGELLELARIYEQRRLAPELAHEVAAQPLRARRPVAHARDELGRDEKRPGPSRRRGHQPTPFRAAALPLATMVAAPAAARAAAVTVVTLSSLGVLGDIGAQLGGDAPRRPATFRVIAWGLVALATTAAIGALVGALS